MREESFSSPLGDTPNAALYFEEGACNVRIRTDHDMADLFRARFEHKIPDVRTDDGRVRINFRRGTGMPGGWWRARGEIVLNAMVPWRIEIRGGVSNLDADLTALRLLGLEVGGGVHRLDVAMPDPVRDVGVRIGGGVSHLRLHRPQGSAAGVHVGHGAARVRLDGLRLGAVGGGIDWQTNGFDDADDRYEIQIGGGASDLLVDAR